MAVSPSVSSTLLLDAWIADSGANQHMCHKLEWFTSYKPLSPANSWPITSIAGHKTYVAGTGTIRFLIQLPDRTEIFSLDNVLYVPGLDCNLFSTTAIAKKHGLIFTGGANSCTFTKDSELYLTGRLKSDMYILDITVLLPQTFATHANSFGNIPKSQERQSLQTWHHRFAHLNFEMIKQMERRGSVIGLQLSKREPDHMCVGCQFGKHQRASFPDNPTRQRFPKPGDLIHGDICGPMSVPSYGGSVYFVLFKDDATSYRFVFCIRRKSEALACFKKVCLQITKDTGHSVQMLRTDRGGEFANKAFDQYLDAHSIRREYTAPYTPEQNSVAERENRTIMEGVRSCLHHARINLKFWAEAVQYLVYTLNRTGTRLLSDYTPFEAYFGIPPSVSHLRPFGCPTFVHIPAPLRKKLDPKAQQGIFVGYSDESKAFRIWIPGQSRVITSRDVTFDEEKIVKYTASTSQSSISHSSLIPSVITTVTPSLSTSHSDVHTNHPPVTASSHTTAIFSSLPNSSPHNSSLQDSFSPAGSPSPETRPINSGQVTEIDHNTAQATGGSIIPQPFVPASSPDDPYDFSHPSDPKNQVPSHTVPASSTRNSADSSSSTLSRRGVNPPVRYGDWYYAFSAMAGTLPPVPKTYKEALQGPFASQWQAAMDEEFHSLITNKTWRLTRLPPGRKAIRCKWVYALKTKPDGSLDRFKARLVAKGCSQIPGVDFHETFSPTVKYDSLRIILALVASLDLHMQQFDIKTAFLYGSIQEEIYMEQVEGYVDQTWIDAVCQLLQALYGLRQSSRAWSKKLEALLKAFGLIQSDADHCVYYSHQAGVITIVTIFVDDGLICSNDPARITSILKFMSDVFVTKVSDPEVYVGLHLTRDRKQRLISIDQERYIQEKIVDQYGLHDAHPVATPADPSSRISAVMSSGVIQSLVEFPFLNMIGSCQFAAITTRCDIAYATNAVATSKRQGLPTATQCNAIKRIGRYLKGTKHFKLVLGGLTGNGILTAFTDADYGADHLDRKSRTGYILFFNNGPVAWGSKKQSCVATSTTHAEYIALYTVTKEVIWCRRLLADLGFTQTSPTVIYTDSQSALRLAMNPEFHAQTKHIDIKYHYTREQILLQSIQLQYINTHVQLADILTKPLTPEQFRRLRDSLLTGVSSSPLET